MELRPLRVELRLIRIVAHYEFSFVTNWVEAVTKCRPLSNFVRYELNWGCYELSPAMKFRPLRVALRLLRFFARYETSSVWVELKLLRIVARYETSSVTSWVEAVTKGRPLWNFVRYELSWGCYELSPAMKLCPLRVELRLFRIVARYETSSVTSWVEAVTNCCLRWNFVRYELRWGCYDFLPAMKLRLYELSWSCYELSHAMKLRPLRVELRLLRIVARYETSSVSSWVEAVTKCCPLWIFVRYELSWGC